MENIAITVDYREKGLIELIKANPDINLGTVQYENLDVADIIIYFNGAIVYLIERKTWTDLAASIKDGRYRSQKLRLIRHALDNKLNRSAILYLLEGKQPRVGVNGLSGSILQSACVNMQTRDGFRICHTANIGDTYIFLQKVCKCLMQHGFHQDRVQCDIISIEEKVIKSQITIKKKNNLTPQNIYIHQLSVIPGVSTKTALAISQNYKSMSTLIGAFLNKPELLSDINIGKRRIGKKLSERIYNSLY